MDARLGEEEVALRAKWKVLIFSQISLFYLEKFKMALESKPTGEKPMNSLLYLQRMLFLFL